MSIHEIAVKYASYLANELESDHRQELRMAYGLEILLGEIVKQFVVILSSWLLGVFPEVFTMSMAAGILRLASGGEHCSEYYRCLVGGTIWFLLWGLGIHHIYPYLNHIEIYLLIALSLIIALLIVMKYAPAETENKPINSEKERSKLRRLSVFITFIFGLAMIFSAATGFFRFLILPLAVGMLEQVFTITPWGYGFIHYIDRILDFNKWSDRIRGSEGANS